MTSIHPSPKNDKKIVFDVRLDWLSENKGILTAHDTNGSIYVATPPAFGGEGREWSPEHLFLGSLSSCFMTTYMFFARRLNFPVAHFECHAIGQIELVEGRYKFTHINIYPNIYVADGTLMELAQLALIKAQKHCLISYSVSAEIGYCGKVLTTPDK